MSRLRNACGPFFIAAGVNHFIIPKTYESMVPKYLPRKKELVQISGVMEIMGGVGMMLPATRQPASKLLLATLAAVFPANIDMALHPERFPKIPGGRNALLARLPLQFAAAAWVMSAAKPETPAATVTAAEVAADPAHHPTQAVATELGGN